MKQIEQRHPVRRRADQGRAARHRRQDRLFRPPDDRAFQVPGGEHARHAEDDDPLADACCTSASAAPRSRKTLYPDLDVFFDDLGKTYAKVVKAFYDAGCRYLQFDDTIWAFLCSEKERAQSRQRGDNPDELPEKYAAMINQALAAKPADMTITTHICRGNFRSTWISEGGYEPVAEVLFGELNYDGYLPRIRHRARRRLRAAALRAEGQQADRARARLVQDRRAGEARTTSSAASTRRRNTSRSTSSASRRNAALPRPRKATC